MALLLPLMLAAAAIPVVPGQPVRASATAQISVEIISAEPIAVRNPPRSDRKRIDRSYQRRDNVPTVDFL